ncbi:hypothetical protein A4U53_034960 (plasmid) [Rhizobium ruizarguesonis]|uniref:Uncharacterized protein n=1 Tax=Rhizobium ruizarguesonis TaxID=2081791 RepID=A0ACD5EV55_9HYPH|nr:hypothetical protein [Rhizobium leguminosarum]
MNSRSQAVFSNARPVGFARINRASWIDTLRVSWFRRLPSFDAAGIAVFRTLALLACHPSYWASAVDEVKDPEPDRPFTGNCLLEALRLWPTTPVILR